MLSEIEKGNASEILAWNPDRLARNSVDGGKVIYLVDTGKIQSLKCPPMRAAQPRGSLFLRQIKFGGGDRSRTGVRKSLKTTLLRA